MKIPFIKVKQKGEVFYISKMKAIELREYVNFEFRDPYFNYKNSKEVLKFKKYMDTINKEGIDLQCNPKGVQRQLQIERIRNIRSYLEENVMNFFPNSVILSLNVSEDNIDIVQSLEEKEMGEVELTDKCFFNVIDGQHRLAGIFSSKKSIIDNFDIPVVLLVDISVSNAVKLFLDINSNQKQVSKSVVYDLYEDLDEDDIDDIRKIHTICQKLYKNSNSPLYRQVKMLGVGSGAISQAFFIDSAISSLKFLNIKNTQIQELYNHLFSYFRAYQKVFPNDWPVPLIRENESFDDAELDNYAHEILVNKKSQLVKTTGFGAIMGAFEYIYNEVNSNYKNYINIIERLKDNVDWTVPRGSGKSAQNRLSNEIIDIIKKKK